MAKILKKISLDLSRDKLHVWEMEKSAPVISRYVEKNIVGDRPPRVEVVRENGIYQLVVGGKDENEGHSYNYGGHKRAMSHYISGDKLDCSLLSRHRFFPVTHMTFAPVTSMLLTDYDNDSVRDFLSEVSDDVFLRFVDSCGSGFDDRRHFLGSIEQGFNRYFSAGGKLDF